MPPHLDLPVWSAGPFVLLLLAIAILPVLAGRFWHRNRNKALLVAGLGVPTVIYLIVVQLVTRQPAVAALGHELEKYACFIVLLGSLYTVSGGLVLHGGLRAGPLANTGMLALGAALANLIGTTGASMVLIRPFLRINQGRQHAQHLPVFFIFTVSNLGGLLTPLGDPPLFLGFLNEVPFSWTLGLWPEWLLVNGLVLAVFFLWETVVFRQEAASVPAAQPLRIEGLFNLALLAGIVGAVLVQGAVPDPWGEPLGAALMLGIGALSLAWTPARLRKENAFSWGPMLEVAILFAGIFVTMVPALELLGAHGRQLGITEPWEYFWLTGLLSSCLDNAPTYLAFATLAAGSSDFSALVHNQVAGLDGPRVLQAISCGAVFLGALSYIGNGPNFLVKAMADEAGFRTPSFHGYLLYSGAVLLPVFVLATVLFFRPG